MGKSFWPLLFIVAALGAAAIWTRTPYVVPHLPEGLRAALRESVRLVCGLSDLAQRRQGDNEPVVLLGGTTTTAAATAPAPSKAPATVERVPPAPTVTTAPVAVPSVRRASVAQGDWCVLTETTPVENLSDKPRSVSPGGRFFLIERRARDPRGGTLLIGNFTPRKLPYTVQINSRYALCLTGSPDDLTTGQLHALKMYYQLRGEARDYLAEVRESSGDTASPYYKQLREAERIRDFREKELREMKTLAGEQRTVEVQELMRLKREAAAIRAQHENWKQAHHLQITDPTQDPHYLNLVREYRNYISAMPAGLALD